MLQKNEKNIKIESDKVGERTEEKEGESECERMAMAERENARIAITIYAVRFLQLYNSHIMRGRSE